MKNGCKLIGPAFLLALSTACTVTLPFNHRLDYNTIAEAKRYEARSKGPISIVWVPETFPSRVDVQGASGFVGGGSRTRIPIGVGLSQRITETLDAIVGVSAGTNKKLTITIDSAKSTFQYSAGILNVTPAIDDATCVLKAAFDLDGKKWEKTFSAKLHDSKIGGSSTTGILEKVWDDLALQVAKDVVSHLD